MAYIARVDDFDCGIMISASHNPYYDNGIKLIDCYGEKMPEEILLLVEDYIDGKLHVFDKDWPELPFAHREHIGCTVDYVAGRNRYMGYLISLGIYSFKGVKVGLLRDQICFPNLWPIHAIGDKVRFSVIRFLEIVLHTLAQNDDFVRIFHGIFFALTDKFGAKP